MYKLNGYNLELEYNKLMASRVLFNNELMGDFSSSEKITVDGAEINSFKINSHTEKTSKDSLGEFIEHVLIGTFDTIEKKVEIKFYEKYKNTAIFKVTYKNTGNEKITINSWTNNMVKLNTFEREKFMYPFWTFQGGSYTERPDWILPINNGFCQENFQGMNEVDYGGGTPVSAIWNKKQGLATGHLSLKPRLTSHPVEMPGNVDYALQGVKFNQNIELNPGEKFETLETFITAFTGSAFVPLEHFREMMEDRGMVFHKPTEESYEATWCAWGYERDFTMDQVYGALPKVKDLGMTWACLDDGYQVEEGTLDLIPEKYPNGDADMRAFVDGLHERGVKAQLWWIPMTVDPKSILYKEHPEYTLINKDGKPQEVTWWDTYYLCPADKRVQELMKEQIRKILIDWDYDGLKIDGQHLNTAPPCYNPEHNHAYPEESTEALPEFMKMIYDTVMEIKPEATIMFCPCGTEYNFYTLPYFTIPVSSDPESSWQIRSKGTVFKALMGADCAYHGDHVEISSTGKDFASTVGVGGIIDTKFTWPVGSMKRSVLEPGVENPFALTETNEEHWKKWLGIYYKEMISKGQYRGDLYTLGFEMECHVVEKEDTMYYAFYLDNGYITPGGNNANQPKDGEVPEYDGEVEFKGLEQGKYEVIDYTNNDTVLGTIDSENPKLHIKFRDCLLVKVKKV
jgi:alpha-galactosidase